MSTAAPTALNQADAITMQHLQLESSIDAYIQALEQTPKCDWMVAFDMSDFSFVALDQKALLKVPKDRTIVLWGQNPLLKRSGDAMLPPFAIRVSPLRRDITLYFSVPIRQVRTNGQSTTLSFSVLQQQPIELEIILPNNWFFKRSLAFFSVVLAQGLVTTAAIDGIA